MCQGHWLIPYVVVIWVWYVPRSLAHPLLSCYPGEVCAMLVGSSVTLLLSTALAGCGMRHTCWLIPYCGGGGDRGRKPGSYEGGKSIGSGRRGGGRRDIQRGREPEYFAIGKAHRGGNCYRRGRELACRVWEARSSDPPVHPQPYLVLIQVWHMPHSLAHPLFCRVCCYHP